MFGNPVEQIIRYAKLTGIRGYLIMSVPSEFWTDLNKRNTIMGIGNEEYQRGVIQVEIREEPRTILRRCGALWRAFKWDHMMF